MVNKDDCCAESRPEEGFYKETYRGQFHFSPKSGFMNDINGLWHFDGMYYLTHQTTPDRPTFKIEECSVGFATSPDMLNWKNKKVIFKPGIHGVPGSGSVIVDSHNVSRFKDSKNPPFIAFYSGTTSGVCIGYSNDLGETWNDYAHNPVIPSPEFDPRDPHVFWHKKSGRWILAIYGPGMGKTSFYVSENLREWKFASLLDDFGYECPDIFELAVDGDQNHRKWILMKADGQYIIGDFNGCRFIPDEGGPYDSVVGPHFYAAQSFFRETFPDERVVQIGWMGIWDNMFNTSPWNQNATFPVELKLLKCNAGIRLARSPIAEISKIHAESFCWHAQELIPGQNLYAAIEAKCYDIEAEFGIRNTDAAKIEFVLAGKVIAYDIINKTLLGKKLYHMTGVAGVTGVTDAADAVNAVNAAGVTDAADAVNAVNAGDTLKIRILCDWSQLEVFANDGLFSWTERVPFPAERSDISLSVDGKVKLISMAFHTIKSTWHQ